jgi:hypothetical protein
VFYQDNAGELTFEDAFRYTASTNTLAVENITGTTVTGSGVVKGSNTFGQRYATQAATNRAAADTASLTVERYFTVTAEGNGESFNIQSNTPSAGNKIVRKIWYKDEAFEDSDVDTWTLLHTFADDATYASTATKWQEYLDGQANGTPPFTLAISWEEATLLTALLDGYTADLAFAYSLAWLNPSYTGNAIRVRRESDNTEQDIGFDGIDLDTSALTTFCTGTNGFIRTFYDQSGNARNAAQTTTSLQPKVYDSVTGVLTFNGKPYIDGKTNRILPAGTFTINQPFTLFAVARNSAVGERLIHTSTSSLQTAAGPYISLNFGTSLNGTTLTDFTGQHLFSALANGSSSYIYQDGASVASGNAGSNALVNPTIFTRTTSTTSGTPYGYAMICYAVDKSTDRAAIDTALNNYYSIY